MAEQNIAACLTLSAIGGMMGVLATAILAYPDAQKTRGKEWSPCAQHVALLLSLIFQVGIAIATIAATWYGPVSIVVPTSSSAQLLFNMVMFGVILGLESFSKEMRVGAYVVVLAAILLPVVGPGTQENQDILALLQKTGSIVWSSILLASLANSSVGLVISNSKRKAGNANDPTSSNTAQDHNMFVFNLVAQTSGAVVGTTVAKMFVLVTGAALGVCIALWLVSSLILVYATILQATTVSQGKFVPLSVGAKISINAITGIIIWEDWKVVSSWIGYVCVFLYLMLGNYLLCDVDLFGVQNASYGTAATLEKVKSVVFDPQSMSIKKSDLDQASIEMQHLEEARSATMSPGAATDAALPDPEMVKSSSTSEAADWISSASREYGSEGARSSSTAEADDYDMADQNTPAAIKHKNNTNVAREVQEATPTIPLDSTREPTTESGFWRKAYHVHKKDPNQKGGDDDTRVDSNPQTPGVWRKAYKVKK